MARTGGRIRSSGGSVAVRLGVPLRLVLTVALGTLLNPLNSSMIAVALVQLQRQFDVGVATSTWLVSGFYLAAAVGQPLMGRFVDLLGPRRLFVAGLAVVLLASLLAPFAPSFGWLVAIRALQGIGSSAAFPSALVVFRQAAPDGPPPAGALAVLALCASSSAAAGPVLGGAMMAVWGWQAVFLINIPLTIAGIALALAILPAGERAGAVPRTQRGSATPCHPPRPTARELLRTIDLPGVALFAGAVTALLGFLLSIARTPLWWLAPVAAVLGVLLVLWELRVAAPFLDVRGLATNRPLTSILAQQGTVNLVFYSLFFSLPVWLEAVRGMSAGSAGPMMLPLTLTSLIVTPLTARAIRRSGARPVLIVGSALALVGTLMLQLLNDSTPIALVVLVTVVMGVPNGLNNLGLQTGLYAATPPERTGSSGGLFQTFRYLGAILASSVLGVLFERTTSSAGLHHVGYVASGAALLLVVLALLLPRSLSATGRS